MAPSQRSHKRPQAAAYLLRFSLFPVIGVDTSIDWLLISRPCLSPPSALLPAFASLGHTHVTSSFAKNAARQPCKPRLTAQRENLAQMILAALHCVSCPSRVSELSLRRAAVMNDGWHLNLQALLEIQPPTGRGAISPIALRESVPENVVWADTITVAHLQGDLLRRTLCLRLPSCFWLSGCRSGCLSICSG